MGIWLHSCVLQTSWESTENREVNSFHFVLMRYTAALRNCRDKKRNIYKANEKRQRCNKELGDTRLFANERLDEYCVGNKIRNSQRERSHLCIPHFYFCKSVIVIKKLHWDRHLVLRSDYGNTKCSNVQQD